MTAVDTHLLLRALIDELTRCGMQLAATAAGSRNTPIVEAMVNAPSLTAISHIDERSAGFFAVGAARASGRPVAVTVTSGTAVANLLPAVVEASEAGLPLILLTADRPAELRQVGAGQAIDQVKIFGAYTRFFAEPDLESAAPERMRWLRSLACRSFWTALGPDPGPVQLNIPLREPLNLDQPLAPDRPGTEGRAGRRPWVGAEITSSAVRWSPPPARAVIVAGSGADPGLADYAADHGIPLLADPLSGARRGPAAIANYDLILRDDDSLAVLAPELVLRFGDLPTSKPLRRWLAGLTSVEQVAIHHRAIWPDPDATMARRIVGSGLPGPLPQAPDWLARWRGADMAMADVIAARLGGPLGATASTGSADRADNPDVPLSEPLVARLLIEALPETATLFVAASMPIRDLEEFAPVRENPPRVLANRGANGIDGTISAALGVAASTEAPVVALTGDVALAHDIGGLLTVRRSGLKLTVVLINNDGGGIFHFLPIATAPGAEATFSEHVTTPHGLDFVRAATLYGFDHVAPTTAGGFMAALNRALEPEAPSTIIEVRTDRVANRLLHTEIADAAAGALSALPAA